MRILFMGTPDYAKVILEAIWSSGEEIVGAVTQPDRPKGRGHKVEMSPVKVFALEHGIEVFQPQTMKDGAFLEVLERTAPDMAVVAAYGKILPEYILSFPKLGCINAHASILPKYRGASPIQRAIMDGERESGVTAMYMDDGIDTGDIILTKKITIEDDDDFEAAHDKLAAAGAEAILDVIALAKSGEIPRTKQPDEGSTYAAKIVKEDRILDFSESTVRIHDRIRALSPFPKAITYTGAGQSLQILASRYSDIKSDAPCGTVVSAERDGFAVKCGDGCLVITSVIPEGKGKMSGADLMRGRKLFVGDVLGARDE